MIEKPIKKTKRPLFSSGPCAKFPNWQINKIETSILGRSHRAKKPKDFINYSVELTSELLEIPKDYKVAIVPASDTGAFEMAMWNFLGHIPVDVFAWESFGKGWVTDIIKQLGLEDANVIEADYGILPDLHSANSDSDIVFTLNGTTSGVRVPNLNWIKDSRKGITLCDATSGLFAQKVDWSKLDVTTFSWQKVLGGEAQHGMIILSPKAIDRLNEYTPSWPLPKIFRIKKRVINFRNTRVFDNKLIEILKNNQIEMICLAGFMKILSKNFIKKFKGKILNIHPSLLPKYRGLNTHQRALKNKDNFSGCTIHLVNSKLDSGKIILQKKVKIYKNDTPVKLEKRILKQEHIMYPKAIKKLLFSL